MTSNPTPTIPCSVACGNFVTLTDAIALGYHTPICGDCIAEAASDTCDHCGDYQAEHIVTLDAYLCTPCQDDMAYNYGVL